jgi:hypothetical protein
MKSIAEWDAAQVQGKKNSASPKRNSRRLSALRGRGFCGLCGHRFCGFVHSSGISKYHKKSYDYRRYRCGTAWNRSGSEKCPNTQVSADLREGLVWDRVRPVLEDPERFTAGILEGLACGHPDETTAQAEADLTQMEAALAGLEAQAKRVRQAHAKGLYDDEADDEAADQHLREALDDLKAERSLLRSERARLRGVTCTAHDMAGLVLSANHLLHELRQGLERVEQDEEARATLLQTRVHRVELHPGDLGPASDRGST